MNFISHSLKKGNEIYENEYGDSKDIFPN